MQLHFTSTYMHINTIIELQKLGHLILFNLITLILFTFSFQTISMIQSIEILWNICISRHVSCAKYMCIYIYIYVIKQLKLGKTGDCVNLRSNSFHRRKYFSSSRPNTAMGRKRDVKSCPPTTRARPKFLSWIHDNR